MADFLANTDEDWMEFLRDHRVEAPINFWSPTTQKPLLNALPGGRLFLYAKIPLQDGRLPLRRRVVGWGRCAGFDSLSIGEAWKRFGFGNGAGSVDAMLARIGKFQSSRQRPTLDSIIGCTILGSVEWFDAPLDLRELGIHWKPQTQRGRTLLPAEVRALDAVLDPVHHPRQARKALERLRRSLNATPPSRKKVVSERIERDPMVIALIRERHPRFCQYCGQEFFLKRSGRARYCEVHHVIHLSRGGLDILENCIALCANCHRKMHHGQVVVKHERDAIVVTEAGAAKRIQRNSLD